MQLVKELAKRGIASEQTSEGLSVFIAEHVSEQLRHDLAVLADGSPIKWVDISHEQMAHRLAEIRRQLADDAVSDLSTAIGGIDYDLNDVASFSAADDEPVARLLDSLIEAAVDRGASDIHIDSDQGHCVIRMRIDGVLSEYVSLPAAVKRPLMSRLKIIAGMDITEIRRPQDGAIKRDDLQQGLDIRVATIPGKQTERAVLRLFQASRTRVELGALDVGQIHISAVMTALSSQEGLILVCGPTGSGKTTTIYAMLETLKYRGLNIMTVEDPIEVDLDGVAQSQVNPAVGYTFDEGLRALLRQDPDVILVGEIRDETTADAAIRAALTGHLVIATVHANSPAGAVSRLVNLGVDLSLIADALIGVFNQRLVRTYCHFCASTSRLSEGHHSEIPVLFPGCESCFHTGFKSRRPVMEHVLVDSVSRERLMRGEVSLMPETPLADTAFTLFKHGDVPLFEVCRLGGGTDDI